MTLHSSWHGLALALTGAAVLVGFAAASAAMRGLHPVNTVVLAFGVVLGGIVLADYPVATTFDERGVHRRAPLRRSTLDWDVVDRFTRTAPNRLFGRRRSSDGRLTRTRPGGLVASVGRRRYMLVNQCESLAEHAALVAVVRSESDALADTLDAPPGDMPPTWLYRRRRWGTPDGSG